MKRKDVGREEVKEVVVKKGVSRGKPEAKVKWEKPVLEDVSGRVMAQPYIRFT